MPAWTRALLGETLHVIPHLRISFQSTQAKTSYYMLQDIWISNITLKRKSMTQQDIFSMITFVSILKQAVLDIN